MNRIKILVVEENNDKLKELQSFLAEDSDRWDITFVDSGVTAIEYLEKEDYTVVVTDIIMPIIDGHQLLSIIQDRFPKIIRIVFSDCTDKSMILKVAPLVHRYISKPCTAENLRRTIVNTLYIHIDLDNEAIKKVLLKTSTLPSVPTVYTKLMHEIDNPEFSLKDASRIISEDMGLTVNILKQVNHMGLGQQVSDIEQAVSLLGMDVIRAIALTSHLFTSLDKISIEYFSLDDLMEESYLTALFAKEITLCEIGNQQMADEAFIAGLLHRLGTLVFVTNFPDKYEAVLERVVNAKRPIIDVEHNLIGVSHPEVGAHLLALWGMPESILNGVALYRFPEQYEEEEFSIVTAVYSAFQMARQTLEFHKTNPESKKVTFNCSEDGYLTNYGFSESCHIWIEKCQKLYEDHLIEE